MRVLIVEDEPDLAAAVQRLLQDAGFVADVVHDGEDGLMLALDDAYDLVILDLMLPRTPGDQVLAAMRSRGRTAPVLVLTARDLVGDRVRLLDAGADDYLIKPFEPAELVSRCRALLRRAGGHTSSVVVIGDVSIDIAARTVSRGGRDVPVTPREFRVVQYLAMNRGRVISREELQTHLYSDDEETWSNVLEVYVSSLRRKLGADLIQTRRGHGYVVEN